MIWIVIIGAITVLCCVEMVCDAYTEVHKKKDEDD